MGGCRNMPKRSRKAPKRPSEKPVRGVIHAVLRDARHSDLAAVLQFYNEANDPNLLPRPSKHYEDSIEKGFFYIVEVGGQLVAAAGVFYRDDSPELLEAGSG